MINNEKLKNDISNVGYRHFIGKIFLSLFIISTLIGIIGLIILLIRVGIECIPWLSTDLINN